MVGNRFIKLFGVVVNTDFVCSNMYSNNYNILFSEQR